MAQTMIRVSGRMPVIFLGFGVIALYRFTKIGTIPDDIGEAIDFLVAGLALFAPHIVNKFSVVFERKHE